MGKTILAIVAVVAVVAIAVFAPELAPGLVSFLGSVGITVSTAVATAIITAGLSLALGLALNIAYKALGVGSVPKASQTATPQVFRQSIADEFIVYGKRRVGGLLVFFHSRVSGSDHFRYFVIACAGHRCQGIVSWMLNDEVVTVDGSGMVTSGTYANAAWLWFQRGLASETANATFVAECGGNWTTNHKGNGVAAIYAKFQMTDAVVQAGMPNITAVIEGRDEILDTRTGTKGYSRNAALIFYDWMQTPREDGGFGAYDDEIPNASWISAQANVCDEVVGGNPRYAFDIYMTTGAAPGEVRDAMIVNMAGSYTYTGGKHLMRPGYWVPVTMTLEEKDLAGPIQVTPFMTSDASATQIQGTYISPADGYQGMPFTTWTRDGATDIRQLDVDLAFTTVRDQADRVAAIMGKRAACEKQVIWPMNIMGIKTRALDYVQLDSARYGLNNYAWVVSSWGLSFDPTAGPGVVLTLREENSEIYDDATPVTPSSPPTIVQPSGPITASQITGIEDPPQRLSFNFDYTGAAQTGEFSRDLTFNLLNDVPAAIGSGVSWTYLLVTGTVNGFSSASGPQSMTGTGMGTMTVSSLASSEAKVQISAVYNSKTYTKTITLTQDVATAPSGGGGGGSPGTLASKTSGFTGPTTTTFVDTTGAMTGTTPAGVTAVNVNVALDISLTSGSSTAKTVECKAMRDIAGTPTLIGSVQSTGADWNSASSTGDPASFLFTIADTGLTASTAYTWRVYARITAGTRTTYVSGTVTVTT